MPNNWKIPLALEKRIRTRDKRCVYCGKKFVSNPKDRATWEHIDNDASHGDFIQTRKMLLVK
jgi:hypothetical protein